ncbi:MAG: DUF2878 domain-containing protein [Acidobacteriota bacterium]
MSNLVNGLSVQLGWWVSILAAVAGHPEIGPPVVLILIALHLVKTGDKRRELATVAVLGLVGTAADTLQMKLGLLTFVTPTEVLCPLWITALWLHFAITPRASLAFLRRRPLLAAGLGSLAGPAAYFAGSRLGAVSFAPQAAWSLLSLALVWALVLPAMMWFSWRGSADAAE